jgi:hypothetical protein
MKLSASMLVIALVALAADQQSDPVPIGKITYRIPKSYLCWSCGHWGIPRLEVTYPEFKPAVSCADCRHIEFELRMTGRSLDPNSPSQMERFEDGLRRFHLKNATSHNGPYGYEVYTAYPPEGVHVDALGETYVNTDTGIMVGCSLHLVDHTEGCSDAVELSDGNSALFLFPLAQISDVPDVEAGIRKLMASFPSSETKDHIKGGETK